MRVRLRADGCGGTVWDVWRALAHLRADNPAPAPLPPTASWMGREPRGKPIARCLPAFSAATGGLGCAPSRFSVLGRTLAAQVFRDSPAEIPRLVYTVVAPEPAGTGT